MNTGIALMKSIEQSPVLSVAVILAFIIFAMGFSMTLVGTLKIQSETQWGEDSGKAKYIISGVLMLLIGIIVFIVI